LAASEAQCISMKVILVPAVDVVVVVVVVAARLGISELVPEASSEASEASSLPSSDSLAPDARHR
jgi:cytoskeletal protein RodZ